MIKKLTKYDIGKKVQYIPTGEIGIIKSFTDDLVFVVYKYDGDYRNFTACGTKYNDLQMVYEKLKDEE